jgi:hypothetical protein
MGIKNAALAAVLAVVLAGCGKSGASNPRSVSSASVPSYVIEPFTPEQHLIEKGAHLVVADGCSACHLTLSKPMIAPDFSSFAGHHVTLSDGRHVLVDEHFLHEGLLHPRKYILKGYNPQPMLVALRRLKLNSQPQQIVALAAFIEQVGPEPE